MSGLPIGWIEASLDQLCEFNPRHPNETDREQLVSFVPMPAVDEHAGIIKEHTTKPLDEVWKGYTHFQDGDVIFAKITPCMENGKVAVARNLVNGLACGSTEFHVLRSHGAVNPDYLWSYLRQLPFRQDAERSMTGAVGQRRVPTDYIRQAKLPLPPEPEQRRIVAKLDSLRARSSRARNELDHIPKLIERYKQAILAKVFSDLPRDRFRPLSELTAFVTSGSRGWAKYYSNAGPTFVRVGNIQRNAIDLDLSDVQHVSPPKSAEGVRTRLEPNDIVITITADLGRVGMIPNSFQEAYVNQHVALVRLSNARQAASIAWFLSSPEGQVSLLKKNRGVTRSGLGLDDIRAVAVPDLSRSETEQVIGKINTAFAWLDKIATEYSRAGHLLPKLDQAILAKAFRGELVPQDSNDEPASVLMERIAASGQQAATKKARRSRSA